MVRIINGDAIHDLAVKFQKSLGEDDIPNIFDPCIILIAVFACTTWIVYLEESFTFD